MLNPIRVRGTSIERYGCSILVVAHSCEVVAGIHVSCPGKEELLECFESARSERISDPRKPDFHRKTLRSHDGDKLKMIRERAHPIRNEMELGKSNVR